MVYLSIDPKTGIICSVKIIKQIVGNFEFNPIFISPISGEECITIKLNEYPFEEPISILDPQKYVYKDGNILTRPYFSIKFIDEMDNELNPMKLPIQQNIVAKVKLENPDNLFEGQFEAIKVKDRAGFLTEYETSKILPFQSEYCEFTIRSNYPGAAILRVKDTKFLAYPLVVPIKFVQ